MKRSKAEHLRAFACLDCKVDTSCSTGIGEYYMLHPALWEKIHPSGWGMLCIGCAEARLGRQLVPEDFTAASINHGLFRQSERFTQRTGAVLQVSAPALWPSPSGGT